MLFGTAGRIRTADLILTKKPWLLLRRTHSCRERTSNPLCCKGLEVLIMLASFNTYRGVLCRFRVFVGRTVGNRLVSTGVKVLIISYYMMKAPSYILHTQRRASVNRNQSIIDSCAPAPACSERNHPAYSLYHLNTDRAALIPP